MVHDVDRPLTLMAVTALVVFGYVMVTVWVFGEQPYAPRWTLTVSTWLAAAAPLAVLALMRQGWRGLNSRRHLGVLWDVGTFWPRAYLPLAPPSYTERAVSWTRYHAGGKVLDEGVYAAGRKVGEWRTYDAHGTLTRTKHY